MRKHTYRSLFENRINESGIDQLNQSSKEKLGLDGIDNQFLIVNPVSHDDFYLDQDNENNDNTNWFIDIDELRTNVIKYDGILPDYIKSWEERIFEDYDDVEDYDENNVYEPSRLYFYVKIITVRDIVFDFEYDSSMDCAELSICLDEKTNHYKKESLGHDYYNSIRERNFNDFLYDLIDDIETTINPKNVLLIKESSINESGIDQINQTSSTNIKEKGELHFKKVKPNSSDYEMWKKTSQIDSNFITHYDTGLGIEKCADESWSCFDDDFMKKIRTQKLYYNNASFEDYIDTYTEEWISELDEEMTEYNGETGESKEYYNIKYLVHLFTKRKFQFRLTFYEMDDYCHLEIFHRLSDNWNDYRIEEININESDYKLYDIFIERNIDKFFETFVQIIKDNIKLTDKEIESQIEQGTVNEGVEQLNQVSDKTLKNNSTQQSFDFKEMCKMMLQFNKKKCWFYQHPSIYGLMDSKLFKTDICKPISFKGNREMRIVGLMFSDLNKTLVPIAINKNIEFEEFNKKFRIDYNKFGEKIKTHSYLINHSFTTLDSEDQKNISNFEWGLIFDAISEEIKELMELNESGIDQINQVSDKTLKDESFAVIDEYVDLGLPSGTLWSKHNFGALNPEDSGTFFKWREWENEIPKHLSVPTREQMEELISHVDIIWDNINGVNGYKLISEINRKEIFFPASGYITDEKFPDATQEKTDIRIWSDTFSDKSDSSNKRANCIVGFNANFGNDFYISDATIRFGFNIRTVINKNSSAK